MIINQIVNYKEIDNSFVEGVVLELEKDWVLLSVKDSRKTVWINVNRISED